MLIESDDDCNILSVMIKLHSDSRYSMPQKIQIVASTPYIKIASTCIGQIEYQGCGSATNIE